MEIISKKEAKERGLRHYFTGKPCCRGHIAQREVKGHCVECRREDNFKPENIAARQRYAQTDRSKEIVREGGKKFRKTQKHIEYQKEWRAENADKVKATQKRFYDNHKEKRSAASRDWASKNPARVKARMRAWQKANPEKCVAYAQKRYATERQASVYISKEKPFIALMYEMGRELGLHVDHIIPQTHDAVTGLHCLLNLRLIGPTLNMRKGNKFDSARAHMCSPFS